jgi:hypothetical protein
VVGRTFRAYPVFADTPIPLFGRADLFEHFVITIDQRSMTFLLTPIIS